MGKQKYVSNQWDPSQGGQFSGSREEQIITWVDGGVVNRHCQVERHEYKMTEGRRTEHIYDERC